MTTTLEYRFYSINLSISRRQAGPPRTIGVMLTGSMKKEPGEKAVPLRTLLAQYRGFNCTKQGCFACALGQSAPVNETCGVPWDHDEQQWSKFTRFMPAHHVLRKGKLEPDMPENAWRGYKVRPTAQVRNLFRMYEIAIRSQFCLEPSGDTLTRSHFFVAALSGCIPVLFDKPTTEHYSGSVPTWWPWRSHPEDPRSGIVSRGPSSGRPSSASPFVDYANFTVIFDANKIHSEEGVNAAISKLLMMPQADPARYAALREGLDRMAARLHYGMDMCDGANRDAFATFRDIVYRRLQSIMGE